MKDQRDAWIGADPGMSGAVALYVPALNHVAVHDMPRLESGALDHWTLAAWLGHWAQAYNVRGATIERVHAMPKQGVTSSFSFGDSFGAIKQAIASAGMRFTLVQPAVWKLIYGLQGGRENKVASAEKVVAMFPELKPQMYGPKGGVKDGRAEAVLLAHFGSKLREAS